MINGEKHKNKYIEEKTYKIPKREDVAALIREFEDITKKKKKISFG